MYVTDRVWRSRAAFTLRESGFTVREPELLSKYKARFVVDDAEAAQILTERDKKFATTSDVVLANFSEAQSVSIGTSIERGWASQAGVPIVAVLPEGNLHEHPIVLSVISYRTNTLDGALRIIRALGWEN